MSDELTGVQRLQHGLDLFLSKDMEAWTDSCAEDVIAESPFAPEGTLAVIEGRTAFYEYLRGHPETIDVHEIPTTTICTTGDPDVVVMEWSVAGTVVATGDPHGMRCATSVTFRGGQITTYREYWTRRSPRGPGWPGLLVVSVNSEELPTRSVDWSSGSIRSPGRRHGGIPTSSGPDRPPQGRRRLREVRRFAR